ncbi:MAG: MBL fold metallo-hydrolase [Acidimicrobiales bacterium]
MWQLPVADPWFTVIDAGDGIRLITETHVHPMVRCNVWHITGAAADLVVDTSMGLQPLLPLVRRATPFPILAVATHTHADHVGGLHEFTHRAVHGAEAAVLEQPGACPLRSALYGPAVLGPYLAAGYVIDELILDAIPLSMQGTPAEDSVTFPAAPATRLLEDGEVIDLGDRHFEVLHLPGHSPGSIGLWEAATGVLLSGDAIYNGPLLDGIDGADPRACCDSLRRLVQLPVRVVHAGHEPSFHRARLIELCNGYLQRQGQQRHDPFRPHDRPHPR